MTKKLYDENSHQKEFKARVLSCQRRADGYALILDQTAFFPEGGGQAADSGTLERIPVLDVQETDEGIVHLIDMPLEVGTVVRGVLDWETRFRRMQGHSGEHIVSGVTHRLFGYDNVGFHMGERDITIDFNGVLNRDDLNRIEDLANELIAQNLPVTAEYPSAEVLEVLEYRSKLELTENIRIVTIPSCDVCACCAPHVSRTGEVGVIKILDAMRHRGGVRLRLVCGRAALEEFRLEFENTAAISAALSAKPAETAIAVERVLQEIQRLKQQTADLQIELLREKTKHIPETDGHLCLFEGALETTMLRELVNTLLPRCGGICAAFSGDDETGYRFVMGSRSVDLRTRSNELKQTLHGKGGGSAEMMQGSVRATRQEIEAYFSAEQALSV